MRLRCSFASFSLLAPFLAGLFFPIVAEANDACSHASLLAVADGLSDIPSACMVPSESFLIESLYYQNASRVGGTALAAYPLMRMRAGLTQRAEFVLDAPSQVAESGVAGAGVYPKSEPGYGANYALMNSPQGALSLRYEQNPPASRFAPSQAQANFLADVTAERRLSDRLTLSASAEETDGFEGWKKQHTQRLSPMGAVSVGFLADAYTQIATDFGERTVTRRTSAQAFGDLSVARLLSANWVLTIGLGTAFNPVAGAKAHYLAMGVDYR